MTSPNPAQLSPDGRIRLDGALARAEEALSAMSHTTEHRSLFVPGRIEVLGKHTDYAGGRSLVAAVPRGFAAEGRQLVGGGVAAWRVVEP